MENETVVLLRQPTIQNLNIIKHIIASNQFTQRKVTVLLIQDGTYFINNLPFIKKGDSQINIIALKDDFVARGLQLPNSDKVKLIDYGELIDIMMKDKKKLVSLI